MMKKSIFGNLKLNNEHNCPKKILHLNFDDVTLGATTFSSTKNYNKSITPGNLNASVMDAFFGSNYLLENQSIVDAEVANAAAFDAVTAISLEDVTGPFGSTVKALYQNQISRTLTPPTAIIYNQTWARIARVRSGGNPIANIEEIYYSQWRRDQISPALTYPNFLDHSHVSGVAFSQTISEFKTGDYGGTTSAGDYRMSIRIEEDDTGLYWSVRGDDKANNSAVPGVPYHTGTREFWRVDSRIPVPPSDAWYRLHVWIQRHGATCRTFVAIELASDGNTYIICDKVSDGTLLGGPDAQMGVEALPITRFYFGGRYADVIPDNFPCNGYIYELQVWDKPPYFMG